MNLELLVARPDGPALVRDYVREAPRTQDFYAHAWSDPRSFEEVARAVDRRFDRTARERAAAAIEAPGDAAAGKLARVVEEGGYFVTTGQQPALFGGPLYGVYKGLMAARVAADLERNLGRPVQPLFWIASDDHDWGEARDMWVVDTENDLRRLRVDRPPGTEGRPLHRIDLDQELRPPLEALLDALPQTDFSGRFAALLGRHWSGPTTLPRAYLDTLAELLEPFGIAFVQAHDPAVRSAARPVFRRTVEDARRHETLLTERADALRAAGYHVQVPILEAGVNLFLDGEGGRERLFLNGDNTFRLRRSERVLDRAEIDRIVSDDVERLSPNVLLRPLVEASVFPTLSYVAGPGETAYYAQLQPLYEAHGLEMPVIVPRFGVTVVERKIRKVLDKFDLEVEELARPVHEVVDRFAREEVPAGIRELLERMRACIADVTNELEEPIKSVDPTLDGPLERARDNALTAVSDLETKVVQAVKRERSIAVQQIEKARLHLRPRDRPQERVMNAFYYLFRYGEPFLESVAERFRPALPSREPTR